MVVLVVAIGIVVVVNIGVVVEVGFERVVLVEILLLTLLFSSFMIGICLGP